MSPPSRGAPYPPSTHVFFNLDLMHLPKNISPNKFWSDIFSNPKTSQSHCSRGREMGLSDQWRMWPRALPRLSHQASGPHIVHDQADWTLSGLKIQSRSRRSHPSSESPNLQATHTMYLQCGWTQLPSSKRNKNFDNLTQIQLTHYVSKSPY